MARPNLKFILNNFVKNIGEKNMYWGNKIPESIMKMLVIEERQDGAGVLAPYWLGVLERGRGPRKSTQDHGLALKIYKWMERRNMFKSKTPEGKLSEAKSMTWYINKYGNKHFRSKVFVDMYTQVRKDIIAQIEKEYDGIINKITMDIL